MVGNQCIAAWRYISEPHADSMPTTPKKVQHLAQGERTKAFTNGADACEEDPALVLARPVETLQVLLACRTPLPRKCVCSASTGVRVRWFAPLCNSPNRASAWVQPLHSPAGHNTVSRPRAAPTQKRQVTNQPAILWARSSRLSGTAQALPPRRCSRDQRAESSGR